MTTITYKDGVIAYDSRVARGERIDYDDYEKSVEREGVRFFITGPTADFAELVDIWFGAQAKGIQDASALVLDGSKLYHFAVCRESGPWKAPVLFDRPYAIGSGQQYAYAAMDMGADAIEAVKAAAKRDTCTGGTIRVYRINQGEGK